VAELQLRHKKAVRQTALQAQLFQATQPLIRAVVAVAGAIQAGLMLVLVLTAALA